jgi:lysine-N-methylase
MRRHAVLSAFECLGDRCPDTCCKNWSMQLDEPTRARYEREAPELLDAVEQAEESPWIMRKDPATGFCVKFEGGLCGIHKRYGDGFLGDACHFYPRATRALGDSQVMTATLSCPEIARIALFDMQPQAWEEVATPRLPNTLRDYLPAGLESAQAMAVHVAFLEACDDDAPAELVMARMVSACRSLALVDKTSWPQAAGFYLRHADSRLAAAQTDVNDPFNLLHALCGLAVATRKPVGDRLRETISDMERYLRVTLDWQQVTIAATPESVEAYARLQAHWQQHGAALQPVLKRYVHMQLSQALFPFAGLGEGPEQRIAIIAVRLATVRLALMACVARHGGLPPQDEMVRVVQSLSRLLDHLADATFSLAIYKEVGWLAEGRLRGLLS